MSNNLHTAISDLEDDFHTLRELTHLAHSIAVDGSIDTRNEVDFAGFCRVLNVIRDKAASLEASWEELFKLSGAHHE